MPRRARKHTQPCGWYSHCKQLKKGTWSIVLVCNCGIHNSATYTIYLFDKRLARGPVYRAYKLGEEPKALRLGQQGYYLMDNTLPMIHMASPAGPTWCGLAFGSKEYLASRRTTVPNKVSCPECTQEVQVYQVKVAARQAGKTAEALKDVFTQCASDVADEFYPKGHARRGEFIRDAAVLYAKLEPSLLQLIAIKNPTTG